MKHYDFATAIKLRDFYKDKLIGLPLDKELNIPIINLIACVAGKQQECAENGTDLDIDDLIESEQRLMKVYVVVAYGEFENKFQFEELENVLKLHSIYMANL